MTSEIAKSIQVIKEPWIDSPYYDDAERWTHIFWNENSNFKKYFDRLDLTLCAELACGHGRHSEQLLQRYSQKVEALYALDVVEKNVEFTAKRLSSFKQATTLLVGGSDFEPIGSGALTSIFCYDAMVHFSPDIIESYLRDASRVLRPGGRILLHHSNLDTPETGRGDKHYGLNLHARNHMTVELFESLARNAGLTILESKAIRWSLVPDLDRLSLLERPTIPFAAARKMSD
jgi:SAM-dependent methyltransferase